MPRFLSPEWAAAFDAALAGLIVPGPGDEAGLAAVDGTFTVVQQVHDAPEGPTAVRLTVHDGSLHMTVEPAGEPAVDGDVTISLSYQDAVALSKGELVPGDALTAGRIRVRGDLSVLVAAQAMLAAAQPHVEALAAASTY